MFFFCSKSTEKGLLDLSSIRSPKMRKRLMANIADNEESEFESERVTRSETPEVSRPKPDNTRRAITPDVHLNKQMYTPVLPPKELLSQRPIVQKFKSEEEIEAYVQKQMKEMENTLKNERNKVEELEPEVQELLDSYKNVQQRTVPIESKYNEIQSSGITHFLN